MSTLWRVIRALLSPRRAVIRPLPRALRWLLVLEVMTSVLGVLCFATFPFLMTVAMLQLAGPPPWAEKAFEGFMPWWGLLFGTWTGLFFVELAVLLPYHRLQALFLPRSLHRVHRADRHRLLATAWGDGWVRLSFGLLRVLLPVIGLGCFLLFGPARGTGGRWLWDLLLLILGLSTLLVFLLLRRLRRRLIPAWQELDIRPRRCPACDYDLHLLRSNACPECGYALPAATRG